jgi:hypothetical protein
MVLKYSIFRIHTNFKTIKNFIARMEKKPPNFLTYLFGVTPPVRCYPLLRYGSGYGSGSTIQKVTVHTVPVPVPQHWIIEINMFTVLQKDFFECARGNCPFSNLKL